MDEMEKQALAAKIWGQVRPLDSTSASEMEKQALLSGLAALARHPANKESRKALASWLREKKFDKINEGVIRKTLEFFKLDKAMEHGSRFALFPRKSYKGWDPMRKYAPRAAGKKTVELLADNPELIPLMAMPLRGGTIPAYIGAKAFVYKGLNIPTPGHIRHLRQRKFMYDVAKTTGSAVGLGAAGVAGHSKVVKKQKERKLEERREIRNEKRRVKALKDKRAEMYKSAAVELQRIAEAQ